MALNFFQETTKQTCNICYSLYANGKVQVSQWSPEAVEATKIQFVSAVNNSDGLESGQFLKATGCAGKNMIAFNVLRLSMSMATGIAGKVLREKAGRLIGLGN